jgi:hypothetical protein
MDFTPEQLAAIEAMIEDKTADLNDQITALKTKNTDLISEKRTASAKAREQADAREAAEQDALAKSGDLEALKKSLTDKYEREIATRDNDLKSIKIDGAISSALSKSGVMPQYVDALTALYKTQATYADGKATIGDLDITDHITDHLKGEDGGHYVRAAGNSGGGAPGSSQKALPMNTPWSIDAYAKMKTDNPAAAASFAEANGHAYMNNG